MSWQQLTEYIYFPFSIETCCCCYFSVRGTVQQLLWGGIRSRSSTICCALYSRYCSHIRVYVYVSSIYRRNRRGGVYPIPQPTHFWKSFSGQPGSTGSELARQLQLGSGIIFKADIRRNHIRSRSSSSMYRKQKVALRTIFRKWAVIQEQQQIQQQSVPFEQLEGS